jgi:hypothetical protein
MSVLQNNNKTAEKGRKNGLKGLLEPVRLSQDSITK